jgi:hypothetical protein
VLVGSVTASFVLLNSLDGVVVAFLTVQQVPMRQRQQRGRMSLPVKAANAESTSVMLPSVGDELVGDVLAAMPAGAHRDAATQVACPIAIS